MRYTVYLMMLLLAVSGCARKPVTQPVFIPVPQAVQPSQFDAYLEPANLHAALALQQKRKLLTEYEEEELKLQTYLLSDKASGGNGQAALNMVMPMASIAKAKIDELQAGGCSQCDTFIRAQLQNTRARMPSAFTPLSPFSYQLQNLGTMYSSLAKMRQCGVEGDLAPRIARIEQFIVAQKLMGQELLANMKTANSGTITPTGCQHPLFKTLISLTQSKLDRLEQAMIFYYQYAANPPPMKTYPLPAQPAPAQSFAPRQGVIAPLPQQQGI